MKIQPLVFLLLALPACRACGAGHPFVPYRIDAGEGELPAQVLDGAKEPVANDAGAALRTPAQMAPPNARQWTLGTLSLDAPAGGVFRQGLSWDIDGDGHDDALTLVEVVDEAVSESLYFFHGGKGGAAPPVRVPLVSGGGALSLDPRCKRVDTLARAGKRSAAVVIGEACPRDLAPKGADRTVALVSWSGGVRSRLGFDVIDGPDDPTLTFDLDGEDVDDDGLDDVTLRVTLEGGGAPFEPLPTVHALFRWFDRTAGMSREPGEPDKSLRALAGGAMQRAAHAKDAPAAVSLAEAGRALFQAVCSESPARRVAPSPSGDAIVCDAGHALEDLGMAEARALVTMGDALGAIAAADDAERAPATKTPARVTEANGWIESIAPVAQRTSLRAIGGVPKLGAKEVSWGALRFDAAGNVLVRTPAGVVRVEPVHGDEVAATGVEPWESAVVAPDGAGRFASVFIPCHAASLQASFAMAEGVGETLTPLPISSPVAARCATGPREPVAAIPIAWGPGGLEIVADDTPVLISPDLSRATRLVQLLGQPVTPGAPRSPNGKVWVVPTTQGILVHGDKTRLFRASELDHGYTELRDCTVSDDALRVACVRGGVAFVGMWPP